MSECVEITACNIPTDESQTWMSEIVNPCKLNFLNYQAENIFHWVNCIQYEWIQISDVRERKNKLLLNGWSSIIFTMFSIITVKRMFDERIIVWSRSPMMTNPIQILLYSCMDLIWILSASYPFHRREHIPLDGKVCWFWCLSHLPLKWSFYHDNDAIVKLQTVHCVSESLQVGQVALT